jgi:hypothetical protein
LKLPRGTYRSSCASIPTTSWRRRRRSFGSACANRQALGGRARVQGDARVSPRDADARVAWPTSSYPKSDTTGQSALPERLTMQPQNAGAHHNLALLSSRRRKTRRRCRNSNVPWRWFRQTPTCA